MKPSDIECPSCQSQPGWYCYDRRTGNEMSDPVMFHPARIASAEALSVETGKMDDTLRHEQNGGSSAFHRKERYF